MEPTSYEIAPAKGGPTRVALCPRCRFHPASPRIAGYCSWDCHDADDDEEDGADGECAA